MGWPSRFDKVVDCVGDAARVKSGAAVPGSSAHLGLSGGAGGG